MKYIINFYTKAKSFDHLAGFYDACAILEIDEYRDYEKAVSALKDAVKHANKSTAPDKDSRIQKFQQKIFLTEKFIQAKQLIGSNPGESIKICNQLLENVK